MRPSQLRALAGLLDPGAVISDAESVAAYGRDWTGAFVGRPAAVVRPADRDAVARVLAFLSAEGVGVVPQGGRTGLVGGGVPRDGLGEVVLSLERMRAVRRIDADARSAVLEAGVTLEAADAALEPHGMRLPVDLASRGSAQVGGLLATAAGGMRHVRDGALSARVRGLEVVLGDGRVLANLGTLEKNNTGYAWPQLFLGSEGTLGVITAAAVGTVRRAGASRVLWLSLSGPAPLAALVARARERCLGLLAAMEFVDESAVAALARAAPEVRVPGAGGPMHVLVEAEAADAASAEGALVALAEDALAASLASDAVLAQDERERRALWRVREALPEAIGRLGRVRRYDVAVPVDVLADLVAAVKDAVAAAGLPAAPVAYGHLAEGNAHLNMVLGARADGATEAALDEIVYGSVVARAGTISAEHGIGQLKRGRLGAMRSEAELEFMAALKALCDPAGILNPGKVLPPPPLSRRGAPRP